MWLDSGYLKPYQMQTLALNNILLGLGMGDLGIPIQ